jgi:tol-pal system protein YbgF
VTERQFTGGAATRISDGRSPGSCLYVPVLLMAVMGLSGCLARSGGSVPLPYVRPANSVPSPPPSLPVQMADRMQAMERELQRLWDTVEHLKASGADREDIARLQERIAFIENQLGIDAAVRTRAQAPGSGAVPAGPQAPDRSPQFSNGAPPAAHEAEATPSPAPLQIRSPPLSAEQEDYRQAYAALRSGAHEKALRLFEAFLKNHPKSDLTASVLYWAGEAHFALGHFDEAVLYFDRVVKEHPGSNKELSALLKQGQAFEKMGDGRSARIIFEKLVSDHPHTAQGRLAAEMLKALPAVAHDQS